MTGRGRRVTSARGRIPGHRTYCCCNCGSASVGIKPFGPLGALVRDGLATFGVQAKRSPGCRKKKRDANGRERERTRPLMEGVLAEVLTPPTPPTPLAPEAGRGSQSDGPLSKLAKLRKAARKINQLKSLLKAPPEKALQEFLVPPDPVRRPLR